MNDSVKFILPLPAVIRLFKVNRCVSVNLWYNLLIVTSVDNILELLYSHLFYEQYM